MNPAPKNIPTAEWSLVLELPGPRSIVVSKLDTTVLQPSSGSATIEGIQVEWTISPGQGSTVLRATAGSTLPESCCFLSVQLDYQSGQPWNFNGPVLASEIYRQSPHDIDAWVVDGIARQGVPLIALKGEHEFLLAACGSPALYDNYTSQSFDPGAQRMILSSGDTGKTPGIQPGTLPAVTTNYNTEKTQRFSPGTVEAHYHAIGPDTPHHFEVLFFSSAAKQLVQLRQDTNNTIARHFSDGQHTKGFGALSFTTAYLNLRRNETGKSRFWVVPSIEYSNTQYCRDAFWISTMLNAEQSRECLQSELSVLNHFSEYPLLTLIWAYRLAVENPELASSFKQTQLQAYADSIETHVRDGWFYAYDENDGRHDFQYWADQWAFEVDDVVTYNQGLLAVALQSARGLGLNIHTKPETAAENYRSLFNKAGGFFPISKKKNTVFGPDPLVPDLLSQIYFGQALAGTEMVHAHFNTMKSKNLTPFGFRNLCQADGSAPPDEWYNIPGYVSQANKDEYGDGAYLRGGSWLLYDGLFLLDCALHGIREAEDLLTWRVGLDFAAGGTTFEYLNTLTGAPHKPNMGWNIALYAFVSELVAKGRLGRTVLDAFDTIA